MGEYRKWEVGDRVTWWHYDRRGTKTFAGVITGSDSRGPYWRVRRDDTKKIVKVRTTALREEKK